MLEIDFNYRKYCAVFLVTGKFIVQLFFLRMSMNVMKMFMFYLIFMKIKSPK